MTRWRVSDVMTSEVVVVRDDTPVARIAGTLAERSISAVPVVDRYDTVTGVVSWSDLRDTVVSDEDGRETARRWPRRRPAAPRWPDLVAMEVMSAPPVTIPADASLAAAGRLMRRRGVGRLLVVDRDRRLAGVVTRSDLLKGHDRPDTVIREEVTQRILRRALGVPDGAIEATVDDGVVTLEGRVKRRSTALAAVAMTAAVPGVVDVVDRIRYVGDDVAPEPPVLDQHLEWWHQAASLPFHGVQPVRRNDRRLAAA